MHNLTEASVTYITKKFESHFEEILVLLGLVLRHKSRLLPRSCNKTEKLVLTNMKRIDYRKTF